MTDRTTLHAPAAQRLVCELLDTIGEDERTAQRVDIVAVPEGIEINVQRVTGERAIAPGKPRPTELRHYLLTPEPVEVVDLVATKSITPSNDANHTESITPEVIHHPVDNSR